MPELPEVDAVCRRLRLSVGGSTIANARLLRPSVSRPQPVSIVEQACQDSTISSIERRGKHILIHLGSRGVLHVHLRMTGNLYVIPDARFRNHAVRAYFELMGGKALVFEDPRALGKIQLLDSPVALDAVLASVGPEPGELDADAFAAIAHKTRLPVKLLLMDQKKIAGLGNIYAAEALFRAGIHPATPASRVSKPKLARLHAACCDVLEEAKQSSWEAYAEPGRFAEGETFPVQVYGREGEPCSVCGKPIRRLAQGGRSTYYCGTCQRR